MRIGLKMTKRALQNIYHKRESFIRKAESRQARASVKRQNPVLPLRLRLPSITMQIRPICPEQNTHMRGSNCTEISFSPINEAQRQMSKK